ncbi:MULTISPECIES: response regulator transcription factor [Sphingomonas]|uniref:response regulator transcription factor n=1 Tax=Sphingomonas TaxID=13687 RepID=UPI00336442BC
MSSLPLFAVVDDDEAMREALADLIEVFDFDCRTFDGSESFMEAYEPERFVALITDLNLLGESGLQLQRRLFRIDPSFPVIIISAQGDAATRTRAMSTGALAYLTKPLDDRLLLKHLQGVLDDRAAVGRC